MKTQSFNFENLPVRTVTDENEETWFAGVDVCNILGYADPYQKIKSLDEDEYKLDRITDGQGKQKETLTVNEFGLYSLVLSSTKPEAKAFKRWVTHNVLPAIRKAGKFTTDEMNQREENIQKLVTDIEVVETNMKTLKNQLSDK